MISHTLNSILDNCNKRFIPWFTSSSYQLQCIQDLKLIRVISNYMKNVLIYQFKPTHNWYVQKIKIKYGRIWKTNMIFLFDSYDSIYDLVRPFYHMNGRFQSKIKTVNRLLYDCIAYFWGTDLRFLFYFDWGDSKDTWRAVLRTSLIKTFCTAN